MDGGAAGGRFWEVQGRTRKPWKVEKMIGLCGFVGAWGFCAVRSLSLRFVALHGGDLLARWPGGPHGLLFTAGWGRTTKLYSIYFFFVIA